MKSIEEVVEYLKNYDGRPVTLMEICGSHTAAIAKNGLKALISPKIRLISGPGCPVCVTPSAYIDYLVELSLYPCTCVVTFGDLLRVPGSCKSLSQVKGEGASVEMVYAPADILKLALEHPEINYIFAAVGFETTTPVYALLLEKIISEQITNVKLLTALKTMPAAVNWLCANGAAVDGFIAPGHVCTITGSNLFEPLAKKHQVPFGVAGFSAKELLIAIYGLVRMIEKQCYEVKNYYPSVVTPEGNASAKKIVQKYFETTDAVWRGMGEIKASGMILKKDYMKYDAGSRTLSKDCKLNAACCCEQILMGRLESQQCPLFRKVCTPLHPQGACMVSTEGSCFQQYLSS